MADDRTDEGKGEEGKTVIFKTLAILAVACLVSILFLLLLGVTIFRISWRFKSTPLPISVARRNVSFHFHHHHRHIFSHHIYNIPPVRPNLVLSPFTCHVLACVYIWPHIKSTCQHVHASSSYVYNNLSMSKLELPTPMKLSQFKMQRSREKKERERYSESYSSLLVPSFRTYLIFIQGGIKPTQ